ncbi:MAG: right-handed parallel beta-helix repeat-containing protein [Armatimonadetes bacterium]|nr:right-handed parallel beta-helix repeat-containing protein [Armatimonadota bacterium]
MLLAQLTALALAAAPAPEPPIFYVSPHGNDAWTGRLAEPNRKRSDGPLAGLAVARDRVRAWRRTGRKGTAEIRLRAGRYFLAEPLLLTAEDSDCVYTAAPGERVELVGAKPVTGWKVAADDVWRAAWRGPLLRQLFVGGQRRYRPRWPKEGRFPVAGPPSGKPENGIAFRPGDFDPAWRHLERLEVVVNQYWMEARLRIASVDQAAHQMTFTGGSWRPLTWSRGWYVENLEEAFTAPGEWYLDPEAGVLAYRPMPGEVPGKTEVLAPVTQQLLRLDGAQRVQFRGLTVAYTAEPLAPEGFAYPQAEIPFAAAVAAERASHCRFEGCAFEGTGQWALALGRGCHDNEVVRNRFRALGAGAVKVGEPADPTREEDVTGGTLVTDNDIAGGNQVYLGAPAIWIGQSGGNRVAHNEIQGAFEWAVSVGWTWEYVPPNHARDNLVEDNHIHDLGLSELGTHAAVYCLGLSPGTVVRRNHIHDIRGGGYGICLDQGCSGVLVEDNLVHHCDGGFVSNFHCIGNIVLNNVFALTRNAAILRYGDAPPPGYTLSCTYVFCRNLVYWNEGKLIAGEDWGDFELVHDGNLFYDPRGPARFLKYSFDEWKAKGLDRSSVVADPLFADPEHGDFRLKPGSPAEKLGFRPLDLSRCGPRKGGR